MKPRSQNIMMISVLGILLLMVISTALAQKPISAPILPNERREQSQNKGFVPPSMDLSHLKGQKMPESLRTLDPPSRWDWREHGMVTPVRNQDTCGSCYAFASLANIEAKMLIDSVGNFDFSENNAKECNWYDASCEGGNYYKMANLLSKRGTVLESCDPYVAWDTTCNLSCPKIKTLLDWRIISGTWIPTISVLKAYIYAYGPVYTTFYAGDNNDPSWLSEFSNYEGSYTLYYPYGEPQNHAVLIVGWDDTLSHAGGQGAWIVKNSWGTNWGGTCGYGSERGYFTMAYYSANMGGYSSYLYDWQNYDLLEALAYVDEGGWTLSWGYNDVTAWGLYKTITWGPIKITRVEFWTTDATTDIDVYIYDDFDGSNPSNLLASELNNSFEEAGYHSIVLDPPPEIQWGDIYVVVKITNSSYGYPMPVDNQGPYVTGTTYISHYGNPGTWFDMGEENQVDIGIRARARPLIGACCDESDWTCLENIYEIGCQSPLRWQEGVTCTEMNPPCAEFIYYEYLPGDVNMANGLWPPLVIGGDVTYLVNYFKGSPSSQSCLLDGFWCSADANGDCIVMGSDVIRMVAYFRGAGEIEYCADYEPAWPPVPDDAPDGWPNCETPPVTGRVLPSGSGK